jgi:ABC-type Fe3+-siderophore transport system permease subunit
MIRIHLRHKLILLFFFVALLVAMTMSIRVGNIPIPYKVICHSLFYATEGKEYIIVNELRLPRTLLAALIGANLAVAGALMQCLTRNPLADPKIMGVSSGASLVVVLISFFQYAISPYLFSPLVFIGAAVGGTFVYMFSLYKRASVGKMVLAGISISSFFHAISAGLLITLGDSAGMIYSWLAGGLSGVGWNEVSLILPWSILALLSSFIFTNYMNTYALGDDIAKGLGLNLTKIRIFLCIIVVILAGCAVSISGAIGFIGLIVPHIVKKISSEDYRIMVPLCALVGSVLLVVSDIFARYIFMPNEIPVGVVTAFIGCPFFIYLIQKHGSKVA